MLKAWHSDLGIGAYQSIEREKLLWEGVVIKPEPPRILNVVIKDSAGNPLDGASVRVQPVDGPVGLRYGSEQTTDSNGQAELGNIYSGASYSVNVSLEGFYDHQGKPSARVGSEEWSDTQEITLTRADIAKGTVVDEEGNPLGGVELLVVNEANRTHGAHATTDSKGRFELNVASEEGLGYEQTPSGLVRDMVELQIEHKARNAGAFVKMDRKDLLKENVTLVAPPPWTLTVVVNDPQGKPLEGVEVVPVAWHGWHGGYGQRVSTNHEGKAVCRDIYSGGDYAINTTLDGYYRSSSDHLPAVGGKDWKGTIELVMEPTNRTQVGKVIDEEGKPVAGAQVTAYLGYDITATTDADGKFTLKGLPGAKITLSARKDDLRGLANASQKTGNVVITLKKPKPRE